MTESINQLGWERSYIRWYLLIRVCSVYQLENRADTYADELIIYLTLTLRLKKLDWDCVELNNSMKFVSCWLSLFAHNFSAYVRSFFVCLRYVGFPVFSDACLDLDSLQEYKIFNQLVR